MPDKLIMLDEIMETVYPPEDFILGPRLLPLGGCFMIGAATGVGKSWVGLHIAQCFGVGKPLFGAMHRKHGRVGLPKFPVRKLDRILYIDYELQDAMRKQRIPDGLPPGIGIGFPRKPTDYGLDDQRFKALVELVRDFKPEVFILDPLSSSHTAAENTNEMRGVLNRVDALRAINGSAAILIHHASSKVDRDNEGKEVSRKPIEMFRGHSSIVDWADTAIALFENGPTIEEAPRKTLRLSFAKTRYTEHRKPVDICIDFEKRAISEIVKSL